MARGDPTIWNRTGRLARTLSHLHPMQVAFRPVHVARTRLLSKFPALARRVAGDPDVHPGPKLLSIEGDLPAGVAGLSRELERASMALSGRIELVGRPITLQPPGTDFGAPEDPKLVRYQLGYLEAVRSLAIAARAQGFERRGEAASLAVAHVREFVERVPPGQGDSWEPYVVATRLLNLLVARELLEPVVGVDDRAFLDGELVRSLGKHARWLAATLELHLLGNHLFTNGAALFVAGCALDGDGAAVWRELGGAIVNRSVAIDVLPDGGHAERSPMYHALYLDQLSYALSASRGANVPPPAGSRTAAERLARQLVTIAHPDGEIPLLGDSAFGEAPLPLDLGSAYGLADDGLRKRLFGACGQSALVVDGLREFPDTGLVVVRAGDEHLLIDAGPLGTSDQPGHAHADAWTLECSHDGHRILVDGGAGHYDADEARAYFRGPFAHNAVSVDGEGSDELWASFRAAGRARVDPPVVTRCGGLNVVRGRVRAAAGWRAERLVVYAPGELLAVFDRIGGARPGAHVLSHLLFSDELDLRASDASAFEVAASGRPSLSLHRLTGGSWRARRGELEPRRGFRASTFGRFTPTWAIELEATAMQGAWAAAWALDLGGAVLAHDPEGWRLEAGGARIRVAVDGRGLRWEELGG